MIRAITLTCSLNFSAGQGGFIADAAQPGSFDHDAVKHVHSKGLHHLHALLGNAHIWMHLLQHPVMAPAAQSIAVPPARCMLAAFCCE